MQLWEKEEQKDMFGLSVFGEHLNNVQKSKKDTTVYTDIGNIDNKKVVDNTFVIKRNSNNRDDKNKCEEIKMEIDETKNVMLHNIDQIISRGEKLELLIDKSQNLSTHSYTFKKRAKKLRRRMWCKSIGMTVFLILFIIAIIYVMLSFVCGFDFSKC